MAIVVTYLDGPREGDVVTIDELDSIEIGRSAERCRIVLPASDSRVGREHCELRRKAGRYRILLNRDHPVWVNGVPARDDNELPVTAELRLGEDGPRLRIALTHAHDPRQDDTVQISKHRVGAITEVHQRFELAKRRTRVWRTTIATILVVLVTSIAFAILRYVDLQGRLLDAQSTTDDHADQLVLAQQQLARTQEALALAKAELARTKDRLDATDLQVAERTGQMERQIAELAKHARTMGEALRLAQPSVYLVLAFDARQQVLGMATAWVYDQPRGLLATNAHVAQLYSKDGVARMVVRAMATSLDQAPRDHTVTRVILHPGYAMFPALVERCAEGISDRSLAQQMNKLTGACDVALLEVDAPDALAPALRVASRDELAHTGAGDAVGYIGFPSDLVGGFDFRYPSPLLQVGTIVALTDFFLMPLATGDGQLVQVSMPAVGGASGSPVINARGAVVATMSSVQATRGEDGKARVDYKGVNFAQRVDLTGELVAMPADFGATLRTRWEELFRRHFVQTLDAAGVDAFRLELTEQWTAQIPYVGYRLEPVIDQSVTSDRQEGDAALAVLDRVLAAGPYILVAIAPDKRNVDVVVRTTEKVLTRPATSPRFFAMKPFELAADGPVQIALHRRGASEPFTARLALVRIARERSTKALREAKRDQLLRYAQGRMTNLRTTLVLDQPDVALDQQLAPGAYALRRAVNCPEGGHYLAIAVAHGDEDIDLVLRDPARGEQSSDEEADSFPAALVKDVAAGGAVEVIVASRAGASVRCSLWLYRCAPAR